MSGAIEMKTPDYMTLARALLPKIREKAEDPEYMEAYRAWKTAREEKGREANGKVITD